jgi:hypothetical protein
MATWQPAGRDPFSKEPAFAWQSDMPGQLFYNPGGGTSWSSQFNASDPTVMNMLKTGAGQPNAAQGTYQQYLGKLDPTALANLSGSSHTMAGDLTRLLGGMFAPKKA